MRSTRREWRFAVRAMAALSSPLAVEQDTVLQDGVLLSQVQTRPGEQLDLDRLMRDLGRVHGLDAFDLVSFDLEGASGTDLVIHATKRARGFSRRWRTRRGCSSSTNSPGASDACGI